MSDYTERVRRQRDALLEAVEGQIAVALADPKITEVMVDPTGRMFVDHLFGTIERVKPDVDPRRLEFIIRSIAVLIGKNVANFQLEGELEFDGSRVQAIMPPISSPGPTLDIRKRRRQGEDGWPALTLADYDMPTIFRETFDQIIFERKGMAIVGSTGSGKTALGGAFLDRINELDPCRIVTIEDTLELYCEAESWVSLRSSESDGITQFDLVRAAMRLLPGRIVVGEVRDKAAIAMIAALTTGHPGFTTVHGETLEFGLSRIRQLTMIGGSHEIQPEMIAEAINYVVLMRRDRAGPRYVAEMAKVGWRDEHFVLERITERKST